MKKYLCLVCSLLLVFSMLPVYAFADESASEPIRLNVSEHRKTFYPDPETYRIYIHTSNPEFMLSEEDAIRYPALASALKTDNSRLKASADTAYETLNKTGKEQAKEPDENIGLYDSVSASIVRSDTNMVSILLSTSAYYGGLHDDYATEAINYDPETGKRPKLSEMVTDTNALYTLVRDELNEKYALNEWAFIDPEEYFAASNESFCSAFTVGYTGMTFYFDPGVLGSFADGMQHVFIAYADHPGLFREKVTNVPESYVIPLGEADSATYGQGSYSSETSLFDGFRINLDGDGALETIVLSYPEEDEDYITSMTVSVNGKAAQVKNNFDCYCFTAYLMHTPEQNSIWAFTTTDNDYSILHVAKLSAEGAVWLGDTYNLSPAVRLITSDDDYNAYTAELCIPIDPEEMMLSANADILGSYSTYDSYRVGSGSMPEKREELYYIESGQEIVSRVPLKARLVLADGTLGEECPLPAGTEMHVARADRLWPDTTFVDVRLNDGTLRRLGYSVNEESWDNMVDGIPEFEAFEDLPYAG